MASIRGRILRWLVKKVAAKGTTSKKDIAVQRGEMEQRMARIKVPKNVAVQKVDCNGIPGEWFLPRGMIGNRTLMYCHGGGYYNGSLATHRAFVARLAEISRARALHFAYRLAPEHPFPAGVDDCLAVYRWLLATGVDPGSLMIAGESAGGNLVLTTLLGARAADVPLPAGAICISPHFDFTFSLPSIRENAASEVLYTLEELEWMRGIYLGDAAGDVALWRHERVSPVWADLSGLPPLSLHADSTEMLRDDAVTLAQRIRDVGGSVELKVWRGLFHAFPLVSMIPESGEALREMAAFMDRHWKKMGSG
ncbi:MAG: alpha/beta hydrolase [Magnetococcales bacterium]|nr:alpha/beta hydrolase [Magnetococcales bacterium]MBF0148674.1 alpha/beta hydrolase [Magnetococcales bacterium]